MEDKPFTSISGATQETAEPIDTPLVDNYSDQTSSASKPLRESSTSSITTTKKFQQKRATSATNSPIPSRESSPVRPGLKSNTSARSAGPGRSRKNSSQDASPSRSASASTNPPSAAAIQRGLSAASIPNLHPVASDPTITAPTPQKAAVTSELRDTPRWPISPRLRSPPPANKQSIVSPRKTEQEVPAINVPRTSQSSEQQEGKQATTDSEVDDSLSIPGMRTPARGVSGASSTLETVQEISQPNTPALGLDGALEATENGVARLLTEQDNPMDNAFSKSLKAKSSGTANESGSESGGKGEIKMRTAPAAPATAPRPSGPATKSYNAGAAAGRGKPSGEGSTRNMTVETETVSSVPQIAVGGPGAGNNGSLRAKPSSETIRPKKEKKKSTRKTPSVTSGTGEQAHSSRPRLHHHYHHHSIKEEVSDTASSRSPERAYGQGPYSPYDNSGTTSPERPATPASRRPS